MKRFEGQVALVTGAGHGIGRATALRFAAEGASVVIVDRDEASSIAVAQEIKAAGQNALPIRADVSSTADTQQMIALTMQHFGKLNVMFNNAGIGGISHTIMEMPEQDWDDVIAVNLRGIFLSCKYGVPALIQSGGGAIVNMGSSTAGWDVLPDSAHYMASKEGISGLTKSLALQVARYNIRVNAICPGIIKTPLSYGQNTDAREADKYFERFTQRIPLRRIGMPEDVASAVAFLASADAQYITGSLLLIDGGQTLQSWSNAPEADAYPKDPV